MQVISSNDLSDLIGAIYDCAIDPSCWPKTIASICRATHCLAGLLAVNDMDPPEARLLQSWNYDPDWIARLPDYADDHALIYSHFTKFDLYPPDEPISLRQLVPSTILDNSRYAREMIQPLGIIDALMLYFMRQPNRLASLGLSRHESAGPISDRELAIVRLLAPHVRRAVTISDLIDMQNLERQTLAATLDSVAIGVVIVAEQGRILHANEAARDMLTDSSPIVSSRGRLAARQAEGTRELLNAVALAQADEARIGTSGIGIPLIQKDMTAATAHVLPLARGNLRSRIVPQATAAVFIVPIGTPVPCDFDTLARIFGLTPAETRMLGCLVTRGDLAQTAITLGISMATAKTHRLHIYDKMGVSRRTDLLTLVGRLAPPVRRSYRGGGGGEFPRPSRAGCLGDD